MDSDLGGSVSVGVGELCWGLIRFIGRGWSIGVRGFVNILFFVSYFSSCGGGRRLRGFGGRGLLG